MKPAALAIPACGVRLVYLLFALSGASGLIYEVVWMRSLTSAFGVTVSATSVTLAVFSGTAGPFSA